MHANLNNLAARLGWRRDDTMTMLEGKAADLLTQAEAVKAGLVPLKKALVEEFITLCSQLNIERHGMDRERATRLLARVDGVRDELRRLWSNPHTCEIKAQIALLEPLFEALNSKLAQQWSECRSESLAQECKELSMALRARRQQLQQRDPILSFAKQAG